MTNNYKNFLQEYFQKNKLSLPKYNSYRDGGTDNEPIWKSELIYNDEKLISTNERTKKLAENNVAKKLFEKRGKIEGKRGKIEEKKE
jgi:dsRNA-specific ribonuclease